LILRFFSPHGGDPALAGEGVIAAAVIFLS